MQEIKNKLESLKAEQNAEQLLLLISTFEANNITRSEFMLQVHNIFSTIQRYKSDKKAELYAIIKEIKNS